VVQAEMVSAKGVEGDSVVASEEGVADLVAAEGSAAAAVVAAEGVAASVALAAHSALEDCRLQTACILDGTVVKYRMRCNK